MQRGLRGPEWIILLGIIIFIIWAIRIRKAKPTLPTSVWVMPDSRSDDSYSKRRCLACGYIGPMKTWLRWHNGPQLIAFILLLFYIIPGLIFIAWGWGKYKCPKCGALDKNTMDLRTTMPVNVPSEISSVRAEWPCPWCAESILVAAKVCKHCGRDVIPFRDKDAEDAIKSKRRVWVKYESNNGELTERKVDIYYSQDGYFHGWCHLRNEPRSFKLDRVKEWKILDETFERDSNAASYLKEKRDDPTGTATPATYAQWLKWGGKNWA